jgi:hypothetical protein
VAFIASLDDAKRSVNFESDDKCNQSGNRTQDKGSVHPSF